MQLLLVITTDTFMGKEKKKGSLSGKRVQSMYPEAVDKYWYFYNNFGNRWVLYFEHVEKTIVFFSALCFTDVHCWNFSVIIEKDIFRKGEK